MSAGRSYDDCMCTPENPVHGCSTHDTAEIQSVEPSNRFVRVPGVGGFPMDNIAYWKTHLVLDPAGQSVTTLMVAFKTGGYIDLTDIDEAQFTSLVYGEPY